MKVGNVKGLLSVVNLLLLLARALPPPPLPRADSLSPPPNPLFDGQPRVYTLCQPFQWWCCLPRLVELVFRCVMAPRGCGQQRVVAGIISVYGSTGPAANVYHRGGQPYDDMCR